MKKIFLVLTMMLLVVSLTVSAHAFSLLQPYTGGIKFKFSNFEQETPGTGNGNGVIDLVGEQLDGIAKIETINALNPQNTLLWFSGFGGEELTVRFEQYVAQQITPLPGGFAVDFTGGIFNIYLDGTPDFDATYPGSGITDGNLFISLIGVPGIVPVDDLATPFDERLDTLRSTADALTAPFSGKGTGLIQITGGSHASFFGGVNTILTVESDFSAPETQGTGWPVGSEDPVEGKIPEPGTLILLGAGIMGSAAFMRKKTMQK